MNPDSLFVRPLSGSKLPGAPGRGDQRLTGGTDTVRVGPDPRELDVLVDGDFKRLADCTVPELERVAEAFTRLAAQTRNLQAVMANLHAAYVHQVPHLTVQTVFEDTCKAHAAAHAKAARAVLTNGERSRTVNRP